MNEMEKIEQVEVAKKNEKGATMVEYALLASLIAVACILAMTFLGQKISGKLSDIGQKVSDAGT